MSDIAAHKKNFVGFVNPDYARVEQVSGYAIAVKVEAFNAELLKLIPDEGAPADAYMYNAHMGAFARALDEAKDHFVKANLAFYAVRGSGAAPVAKQ